MRSWIVGVLAACGGQKAPADDPPEADTDTDTDADSDADTDADSDSDTDTDTPPPSDTTGVWTGTCEGELYGGGGSGSTSGGTGSFPMELQLAETDGAIEGVAFYADYAYTVAGARTGADVALFPTGYTTTSGTGFSAPIEIRMVLDGNALAGDLTYYPNQTHGLDTLLFPCALTR